MEKFTNVIINKAGSALSKAALSLAVKTSNATCYYMTYQPVQPKNLEKFKK